MLAANTRQISCPSPLVMASVPAVTAHDHPARRGSLKTLAYEGTAEYILSSLVYFEYSSELSMLYSAAKLTEVDSRMARLSACQTEIIVLVPGASQRSCRQHTGAPLRTGHSYLRLAEDGEVWACVDESPMASCSRRRNRVVCPQHVDIEREATVRAQNRAVDDGVCLLCQGCDPFSIGDRENLRPVWWLHFRSRLLGPRTVRNVSSSHPLHETEGETLRTHGGWWVNISDNHRHTGVRLRELSRDRRPEHPVATLTAQVVAADLEGSNGRR